jgi:hypothetical protein
MILNRSIFSSELIRIPAMRLFPFFKVLFPMFASLGMLATHVHAQPRGNPEHPYVKQLTPWGKMQGGVLHCLDINRPEGFGASVIAVGDVNHDNLADWIVGRIRCDTTVDNFGGAYNPADILLFHGMRGGLPDVNSGERIGPTEIGSETTLLASGDWDADGNRDLAVSIHIYNDSSFGNVDGYHLSTFVIFWGNANGRFTLNDTSHLACDSDKFIGTGRAVTQDFDGDGVDDIFAWAGGSLSDGKPRPTAQLILFRGHRGGRWGHSGIPFTPNFEWWNVPPFNSFSLTDQDCDGHRDIVFYNQISAGIGAVSVLYGRAGQLPDTNDLQTIHLDSANGHFSLFTDVTGDGVPELAVNCGNQETIKLYAGKPGQRLLEQYGTGNEPEHGKPWAYVWLPNRIHDGWTGAGFIPLYDLGDGDRDGVGDLWTFSWPFWIEYNGGQFMDSLIDAEIDSRDYGGLGGGVRLGDIDGSGIPTLAFHAGTNGILFFKPTDSIPHTGVYRPLPHPANFRCEHAAAISETRPRIPVGEASSLTLGAVPNPSRGEVLIRWNGPDSESSGILTVTDIAGREIQRYAIPIGSRETILSTRGLPSGTYMLHATIAAMEASTMIVVR